MGFPFKTQNQESCATRLKTACQLKYCDVADIFNPHLKHVMGPVETRYCFHSKNSFITV